MGFAGDGRTLAAEVRRLENVGFKLEASEGVEGGIAEIESRPSRSEAGASSRGGGTACIEDVCKGP